MGLRRRLVLSFGLGSLALCAAAAAATWWLSANYLQSQRTRVATAEAMASAVALQQELADRTAIPSRLERTRPASGEALLHQDGQWFSSALSLTPAAVPSSLREAALSGQVVRQRGEVDGAPRLFVGIPLRTGQTYVAVLPLTELDATLRTLSTVLVAVALLTSLSFTGLGAWASRRALRPLVRVNEAAAAVASGQLDARLQTRDPDLRPLADTFNANAAALQARVQRDARFAADVSHELRSPLTTLVNAVDVMVARREEMSPTAASMLEVMQAELARFARIVRDLLEISVDDGALGAHAEPVRIADLVRAAVTDRVGVSVATPVAEAAVVLGDPRRLERVVCNLLENADLHGGGAVGVLVREAPGAVEVVVDDAGPGVPAALRTDVFERFSRGPRARTEPGGAGLGLALVAQHVRRHGGAVRVEDRPGGGARFVVTLPVDGSADAQPRGVDEAAR